MNIKQYKRKANEVGFEEHPIAVDGNEPPLYSFVEFDKADIDLKIYLTELILCRCFFVTGGINWPDESEWFIKSFMKTYNIDFAKHGMERAIREASEMILSEELFTKTAIGTTFMFGIIEFYAKYLLGWRPNHFDFFDSENQDSFRKMSIGAAINRLRKTNTDLARSLNNIDNYNIECCQKMFIKDQRWTRIKIADRLTLSRNAMTHGESHNSLDKGEYLILLYILFHFHDIKKNSKNAN